MGGTAAGVLALNEVRTRTKLIKVGATAALGYLVLTWATGLWQNQPIELIRSDSLWRAGWGLMAGFFLGGSLPFVENAFGIVHRDQPAGAGRHHPPALAGAGPPGAGHAQPFDHRRSDRRSGRRADRRRRAAGPHRGLFPRHRQDAQAALFRREPGGSTSRHANLAPAMSTLIIIGHVKDGVDLGRQHHLPEPIIDLIEQHHGTTLVEYFFHEANRRSGANPDGSTVQESAFRYPGPKPQTGGGLLMLADAVESASRTLSEPTPVTHRGPGQRPDRQAPARRPVRRVRPDPARNRRDRESLIKSLIGIYHGRVKYPEQRTA